MSTAKLNHDALEAFVQQTLFRREPSPAMVRVVGVAGARLEEWVPCVCEV